VISHRASGRVLGVLAFGAWLSAISCFSPSAHPAIGGWRGAFLSISIHPDHVALVNGFRCQWVEIDATSIRIDPPQIPGDDWFLRLLRNVAAEMRVQEGSRQTAVLVVPGTGLELPVQRE